MIMREVVDWRCARGKYRGRMVYIIRLECGHTLRREESRGAPSGRPLRCKECEALEGENGATEP